MATFGGLASADRVSLFVRAAAAGDFALVDATLVRMILVPSTMELLGRANWWLPRWLDRVVPTISVEVEPAEPSLVGSGAEAR